MKISNKLFNLLLWAALGLSAAVFFGVLVAGLSVLSSKSQHLVTLRVESETADAKLANLEQTKKDVEKYSFFKNVAKTVIPSDKNQAQAVLDINQMATKAGFKIQGITFPISTLGGSASTKSSSSSTSSTSSSTTLATGSALSTSSLNLSQAKPVSGASGLYSLEIIVTSDTSKTLPPQLVCTYPKILDFLRQIESNRRTAQISDVTITPAPDSAALNLSLTINLFIKP